MDEHVTQTIKCGPTVLAARDKDDQSPTPRLQAATDCNMGRTPLDNARPNPQHILTKFHPVECVGEDKIESPTCAVKSTLRGTAKCPV